MEDNIPKKKASDETRTKMSEAKLGDKHHLFGSTRSDDTKKKISETLKSIARFDFDGDTLLPPYVKILKEADVVGYVIICHPSMTRNSRIKFSTKRSKATNDNDAVQGLRSKCLFYLDYLNSCFASGATPTAKAEFMRSSI